MWRPAYLFGKGKEPAFFGDLRSLSTLPFFFNLTLEECIRRLNRGLANWPNFRADVTYYTGTYLRIAFTLYAFSND